MFLFSVVISVVFSVRSSGHFDPMTLGRFEPMERRIVVVCTCIDYTVTRVIVRQIIAVSFVKRKLEHF